MLPFSASGTSKRLVSAPISSCGNAARQRLAKLEVEHFGSRGPNSFVVAPT
jgi:hypothetical protein